MNSRKLLTGAVATLAVIGSTTAATPTGGNNVDTAADTAVPNTAAVSSDSCAAAYATVMAQYVKPELAKQFNGDSEAIAQFAQGVAAAFSMKGANSEAFNLGVRSSFGLIDRLQTMQEMGFPISDDAFCAHLANALQSTALGFDAASADAYLRKAMEAMYPQQQLEPLSAESQQAYINQNKAREGVIETPSGLLFEVITEGEGAMPVDTDTVKVTYTGTLSDGTVFDSTDRPVQFPVNRLVPGFTEGLKMMKIGGKYRIVIPPALGYGDRGAGGAIPPGAALTFTIELIDIVPAANPS
jgi:FKBP-type peptidyl-prolyl cis-trans isomerase FkpA